MKNKKINVLSESLTDRSEQNSVDYESVNEKYYFLVMMLKLIHYKIVSDFLCVFSNLTDVCSIKM